MRSAADVRRDAAPPAGPAAELLGLEWELPAGGDPGAPGRLLMLAVRDNPRRAQLAVSRVLAKHIPVAPGAALEAAALLAGHVADLLGPAAREPVLVLGFCETATGLAHAVADTLAADLLQTTRRAVDGVPAVAGFDEEHSHAVAHRLLPRDRHILAGPRPLVLVDDELTTGTTALNTVAVLQARWPRERYVLAALVDLRPEPARAAFIDRVRELGVRVDVVALASATLHGPPDLLLRAEHARGVLAGTPARPAPPGRGIVQVLDAPWPAGVATGGRHGLRADARAAYDTAIRALAAVVAPQLPPAGPLLVVGTEELIHLPLVLAHELARGRRDGVLVQSTTRSPVAVADLTGYAVRDVVTAPAPDDPSRRTRLHNLVDPYVEPVPGKVPYAGVVVVTDTLAAAALPLARALMPWAREQVAVVALPEAS